VVQVAPETPVVSVDPATNVPATPVETPASPPADITSDPLAAPVDAPVDPSLSAAQVLFLGESALVQSAVGTLSGSLVLAAVLLMIAIAAGIASSDSLRKPTYKGGLFSKKQKEAEAEMLGEYLLIKS